jgi:hypothetical protein
LVVAVAFAAALMLADDFRALRRIVVFAPSVAPSSLSPPRVEGRDGTGATT